MTQAQVPEEIAQFLGGVSLFKNVRDDYKRAIVPRLEPRFFRKEEVIFKEGDKGDALYIIRTGTVTVLISEPLVGLEFEIARLRSGQVFGEMAVITEETRSATCKAIEDTHCLVL